MPQYIRPKQLKENYGIDRVTAWRWGRDKHRGFPKSIRLSSSVSVYDKAELDAWFEKQKDESQSP